MTVIPWLPYSSVLWLPLLLLGLCLIWWDVDRRARLRNFHAQVAQQEAANEKEPPCKNSQVAREFR